VPSAQSLQASSEIKQQSIGSMASSLSSPDSHRVQDLQGKDMIHSNDAYAAKSTQYDTSSNDTNSINSDQFSGASGTSANSSNSTNLLNSSGNRTSSNLERNDLKANNSDENQVSLIEGMPSQQKQEFKDTLKNLEDLGALTKKTGRPSCAF
jgi:hypothetical protein